MGDAARRPHSPCSLAHVTVCATVRVRHILIKFQFCHWHVMELEINNRSPSSTWQIEIPLPDAECIDCTEVPCLKSSYAVAKYCGNFLSFSNWWHCDISVCFFLLECSKQLSSWIKYSWNFRDDDLGALLDVIPHYLRSMSLYSSKNSHCTLLALSQFYKGVKGLERFLCSITAEAPSNSALCTCRISYSNNANFSGWQMCHFLHDAVTLIAYFWCSFSS